MLLTHLLCGLTPEEVDLVVAWELASAELHQLELAE